MTDVQLSEMRDVIDLKDIAVVDAMPGIYLQAGICRANCRGAQPFEFLLLDLFGEGIRQPTSVQFHHIRSESHRHIDLFQGGINKEANANPCRM